MMTHNFKMMAEDDNRPQDEPNTLNSDTHHHNTSSQNVPHRQLIAFCVGDQYYGADITKVREIKAWSGVTPLPNTAPYILGVINLRGTIVPVQDLRKRFGQGQTEPGKTHVVIVLAHEAKWTGLLVDSVYDIINAGPDQIHDVPESAENGHGLIQGLVSHKNEMISLIDLGQLCSAKQD
jgi:purine-binding chemotaxis protein CheW